MCDLCDGKTFVNIYSLKQHMKTAHHMIKNYKCCTCSKCFATENSLKKHQQVVHIKPYNCEVCEEKFGLSVTLKKHIIKIHTK